MRIVLFVLIVLAGGAPRAETGLAADVEALRARLGEEERARIAAAPEAMIEHAAELIHAYGDGGALTAGGIETAIAHARAEARALPDLLSADLDGDGALTVAGAALAGRALAPGAEARLALRRQAADADGDGTATPAEIALYAEGRAFDSLGDRAAMRLRDLMLLDLDGDGALRLEEVVLLVGLIRDG